MDQMGMVPVQLRSNVVAPLLEAMVVLSLALSVMLMAEKMMMGAVSLYAKVFQRRPEKVYKCEPIMDDEEIGSLAYPMVLVQIPMYNEKQVYKLSIGAACRLRWPSDRIIVQVLDDSTDPEIKGLVQLECKKWVKNGVHLKYEVRDNRYGYKAGALKEGMKHKYVSHCDFVAIFDADFQPEPDFLMRTIPFLVHNPQVALVQTRWIFFNSNECLMTRMQEMSMDYHFKVEQESGSTVCSFFGFNGTAGVWRISAVNDAGGWNERTTVEDMDLAVRASLRGWKFIYTGNVKVKSELPSTFKAYRNQQYRWACGPANLFRKMAGEILRTKKVSMQKKFYMMYSFFFVRRIVGHLITFILYCVVVPASVFVPQVEIPTWGVVYVPTIITILNSVGTPRSIHLLPFWVFFENVMSLHRMKAVVTGLLEVGKVNEWVVTEKLGAAPKANVGKEAAKKSRWMTTNRLLFPELGMAAYLFICACYDFTYGKTKFCYYIYPQAIAFFIIGLGYVGTFVPTAS
ncbi:glucomannan 4-beta-mannosyltransferase 1-like [Iris pallida]|uniref:glucomannan 4-beta-mannosyltransferase n=1 Tax=Iris pallida TaxID=29817 RepID=A0AAX6F5Z8_IRIPA|nr:glucomannan 4-beta-mannosyltransferase 1-like [Iris pallida]